MSVDHPDHARWLVEHVMPHEPLLRAWLQGRFGAQVEIDDIVQDAYACLLRARAQRTVVFTDGRLRGATVGLGGRWRSANTLGYRLTTTAAGQQVLDLNRSIKGSPELAVDTFATYSLRKLGLWKLKSAWKLQLNVRNLLDGDGLIPTQVLTDGTPSIFTFRTPRQVILSLQVEL